MPSGCRFSPLSGGFLTGKYRHGEPAPEGARLSGNSPQAARILSDKNFESLDKLEKFAEQRGHTMTELAMSWLASQPLVATVISGATRPEQVEENARSADWRLSADDLKEIDDIMGIAPPARSTKRRDYGVVVKDDGTADEAATEALRQEIRSARTGEEPFFDRGPGYARLSGGDAAAQVDWLDAEEDRG